MSLIEINNLAVTFENGQHPVEAVRGISFAINPGEMLALVGESGSGKSVSANAIMQLLPASAQMSGTIHFEGKELMSASRADIRRLRGNDMSMIFQEPMSALNPLHTIGKQITEMIVLHQSLSKAAIRTRMTELLEMVGMQEFANRLDTYPHVLSGGQRQRIMIAMAMANRPKLLIADEPTTALDVTLQTQILALLKKLQREHDMAILLITHDLTIVKRLADRVAIMRAGKIVEQGDTKPVFANPQHKYTQKLLSSEPKGSPLPLPANAEEVIRCENLKVHFPIRRGVFGRVRDHVKAVDGISLSIKHGQTIGIVGESGSGKSTLGFALLRLIKSSGSIVYLGHAIDQQTSAQLRHLRSGMQIVFQDPYGSLNPRMSVGEIIAEGLRVHQPELSRNDRREQVAAILEQVGLTPEMRNRYPHEFSGGQRQRISIARAMILRPAFVVLDEPTSALDLTVQSQILDLLKQFQRDKQLAYLFISHDLRVIRAISHEVVVMRAGKVIEHQPCEALFKKPQDPYTQTLIDAAFAEG